MTTVTKLALSTEDVALSETLEALRELDLRVKSIVTEGPQQMMTLVRIAGESKAEIESVLSNDPSVDKFDRHIEDTEAGEWLYRIEYATDVGDMWAVMFSNDGTILDAQCSVTHWTFRLMFPERDLLSETVDELEEWGIRVDVKRMVEAGYDTDFEATAPFIDVQEGSGATMSSSNTRKRVNRRPTPSAPPVPKWSVPIITISRPFKTRYMLIWFVMFSLVSVDSLPPSGSDKN